MPLMDRRQSLFCRRGKDLDKQSRGDSKCNFEAISDLPRKSQCFGAFTAVSPCAACVLVANAITMNSADNLITESTIIQLLNAVPAGALLDSADFWSTKMQ